MFPCDRYTRDWGMLGIDLVSCRGVLQSESFKNEINSSVLICRGFPGGASGKEPTCQGSGPRRCQFGLWVGRSPGGGHGDPLQYPCLEDPMDRGTWWAVVHGIAKSRAWLERLSTHALTFWPALHLREFFLLFPGRITFCVSYLPRAPSQEAGPSRGLGGSHGRRCSAQTRLPQRPGAGPGRGLLQEWTRFGFAAPRMGRSLEVSSRRQDLKMDRQWPPAPPSVESICRGEFYPVFRRPPWKEWATEAHEGARKWTAICNCSFIFLKNVSQTLIELKCPFP